MVFTGEKNMEILKRWSTIYFKTSKQAQFGDEVLDKVSDINDGKSIPESALPVETRRFYHQLDYSRGNVKNLL